MDQKHIENKIITCHSAYLPLSDAIDSVLISQIGERFMPLRIVDPQAERAVLDSMRQFGQLTPVIVSCIQQDRECGEPKYELIDGFKRIHSGRQLGYSSITVRFLNVDLRACKAALIQLNQAGKSMTAMEEALVVTSLCREDGLSQTEVARLLGRNKSWVCRRTSLLERLSSEAQEMIKLGLLPSSLGAELARLQRCNQLKMLSAIVEHHLSWRETRDVIDLLQNSLTEGEVNELLGDPRAITLTKDKKKHPRPCADPEKKLSSPMARAICGKLALLEHICIETATVLSCQQLCQLKHNDKKIILASCSSVHATLGHVGDAIRAVSEEVVNICLDVGSMDRS